MSLGQYDRRSHERFPSHLQGLILDKARGAAIPCTVWDLSETGVRLIVEDPADVPLAFELRIPSESARAQVRLIWTTGVQYGAQFED